MNTTTSHSAEGTEHWEKYWNKQTDARHVSGEPEYQQRLAAEMCFHMGKLSDKKILEIGCGDGSLIPYLPITPERYTGIDFSTSLLNIFKKNHPQFTTKAQGALEYLEQNTSKFDLIFSFGVLQYFDSTALDQLFKLQKEALAAGGKACHFGVPVLELQKLFRAGQGVQQICNFKPRSVLKQLKSKFTNNIGNWHKLPDLHQASTNAGYTTDIYGGMNYLYRINLVQQTSNV